MSGKTTKNHSVIYKNCTIKILFSLYNYVIPYKMPVTELATMSIDSHV